MATTEAAAKIADIVTAELVDCVPDAPEPVTPQPAPQTEQTPVQRAMRATLTQTGADPPPGA